MSGFSRTRVNAQHIYKHGKASHTYFNNTPDKMLCFLLPFFFATNNNGIFLASALYDIAFEQCH